MDRQSGKERMAAPVAVLEAAISNVLGAADATGRSAVPAASPVPAGVSTFIACKAFVGRKPGYLFSTGDKGTGYYLDPRQPLPRAGDDEEEEELDMAAVRHQQQQLDPEALLREAEEQAGEQVQLLDARSLKRLVTQFEKRAKENMEARMRYADAPEKFMDSEVELDDAVRALNVLSATPELYGEFVALGAVPALLALLGHENNDIAGDVIDLFRELTDADAVEDQEDDARVLVDALVEGNAPELLVQRLGSLNEGVDEERKGVFDVLAIVENMVEVQPSVATLVGEKTKLLKWLLSRLKPREFDSNKQYAAELLAILLQGSAENQRRLGELNGLDAVLQAVAPYKNRDPGSNDEEEFISDLFDVLCCALMQPANKHLFVQAEGIELMILILKQKRIARRGALRTLDFALTRHPPACERFVDVLGLKMLFPLYMGKAKLKAGGAADKASKKRRAEDEVTKKEELEHVVSIIASLLQNLPRGSRRDRVAAKFVENEFEKTDRLMEVVDQYMARVLREEERLADQGEDEEYDEDDLLLARLEGGLYTLQLVCLVIGHLWMTGDAGVRKRVLAALHLNGRSLGVVRDVLREYRRNLGDDGGAEERDRQRRRVRKMVIALGGQQEEDNDEEQPAGTGQQQQQVEAGARGQQHQETGAEGGANGTTEAAQGAAAAGDMDMEVDEEEAKEEAAAAGARKGEGSKERVEEEEEEEERGGERQRPAAARGSEDGEGASPVRGGGRDSDKRRRGGHEGGGRRRDRSRSRERSRRRSRSRERRRSSSRDQGRRERDREHRGSGDKRRRDDKGGREEDRKKRDRR